MNWLFLALAAHVGNALVFTIDKGILGTSGKISHPARYAAYSGLVAGSAVVLLLVSFALPSMFVVVWSLVGGVCWLLALWLFFTALKNGESSRVVPLTGSSVALFTLLFAVAVLREQLTGVQVIAAVMLIVGGGFLSMRISIVRALSGTVLAAAVFAGAAFAAYFTTAKYIYEHFYPFLAAFTYTRLGVGVVALVLFVILWTGGFGKHASTSSSKRRARVHGTKWRIAAVFFASKTLAMAALLLQNYAIDLAGVAVVNALQGTQYIFLFLFAAATSIWFPKLLKEELHRVALVQKLAGIVLVVVGLGLLV